MRLMDTNLCTEASTTVTASSSSPAFPVSNLKHPFKSKRWRSTGVSSEWVMFDFQTTEPVDSVAILWPKEDGIRLTNSAVVKVQANATNVWTSPALEQVLTIDNSYMVASHYFTSDQNYRYWRVVVEDEGNPWDYLELGVVWIGKSLPVENAQNGFTWGVIDPSKTTTTDFGHKYSDKYPKRNVLGFTYAYLEYEAIQILEDAFRKNGTSDPVLVVMDPEEVVFDKDHYMIYGTMGPQFGSSHVNYNILNTEDIRIEELS